MNFIIVMKWNKPIACVIRYLSRKWAGPNLAKPDGREIDQFDNKHAVHMLYIEQGKVLGYQRMLALNASASAFGSYAGTVRSRTAGWTSYLGVDPSLRRAGPSRKRPRC